MPTKTLPGLVRRSPPSAYWRSIVVATAVTTTAIKILVASRTFGTNDVHYWIDFARGVREFGIIGIYGHPLLAPYNHPPLAGVLLAAINYLVDHGLGSVPLLIRIPAPVADVVTALLVFELVRHAHPPRTAGLAAVMVAASPVLMTVSGFHGNTDPVFVMLALLALYLIVARGWAAAAGAALAAAISIKLVPVVLVPALLVLVARSGWRALVRFGAGGAAVMVPLWGPVLLLAWSEFSRNVLSYRGIALREWGLPQFLDWAEVSGEWVDVVVGPGRFVVLLIASTVPAVLVWRDHAAAIPAAALSLVLFLLLSPAFGMQYLVWPLAAAYLIDVRSATAYNAAASLFVISVYDNWNGARPWQWYEAVAVPFRPQELVLMIVTWAALGWVAITALRRTRRAERPLAVTAGEGA